MDEFKDVALYLGLFIGGLLTVILGYRKPALPKPDAVVAGVGLELGSRLQFDTLVEQVKRIGDILEGKKTQGMEAKLEALVEHIDHIAKRQADMEGQRAAPRRPRRIKP